MTPGEWQLCAAGVTLLVNLRESVAKWENADTNSGYSENVSQSAVATLAGQTPKRAVVHCHQGPLTARLETSKTCAIFHQFVCDSRGLSLTDFGKSNSLLPLRDLETVQRLVFYSQKKKKKKKNSLFFLFKLFCELLGNRGVWDLI